MGLVDEIVPFTSLRIYMIAFIQAAYQNPASLCPPHPMLLPPLIRENQGVACDRVSL
jgi:glutaconyl-CoA decarboxylase subunit alpha